MSNPFKKITTNAVTSRSEINTRDQKIETTVASICCDGCGAPRPKNSNLVTCDYCRKPFMENVKNFKADS